MPREYALLTLERSTDMTANVFEAQAGGTKQLEGDASRKPLRWRVRHYELKRLAGTLADATTTS